MARVWNGAWLTVAFLAELAALAALAVWGWSVPDQTAGRPALAVPVVAAALLSSLLPTPPAAAVPPA